MSNATDRQIAFLKSLFTEAQEGATALTPEQQVLVADLVKPVEAVLVTVLRNEPVGKREASDAITVLKSVTHTVRTWTAPPVPVGLAALNPERTITNKFAKACHFCSQQVPAGEGFAVLVRGRWLTVCKTDANTDPAVREAEAKAAREAALAEHKAEQAKREAQRAAEAALGGEIEAFSLDLFARTFTDDKVNPEVRVAVPSATGNNDLDFYRVRKDTNGLHVFRVIGGHKDQVLAIGQAHKALEQTVFVDDAPEAMKTFGRELEFCGRCGIHLTDETSRALGLGPDCAQKI